MTDIALERPRHPLGVGRIIADTVSILISRLPMIMLLAFGPALIELILNDAITGHPYFQAAAAGDELTWPGFLLSLLINLLLVGVATAAIVQLTYDAKLNRPVRLRVYFATAIRHSPTIIVVSFVSMLLFFLGLAVLIVPGLWVAAVLSVTVPAIVIERAGFRALGRSAELTRTYRWPIVAITVLIIFCEIGLTFGAEPIASVLAESVSGNLGNGLGYLFQAAANSLAYGVSGVSVALIFARLKEIKEGVAVSDLVDVFR